MLKIRICSHCVCAHVFKHRRTQTGSSGRSSPDHFSNPDGKGGSSRFLMGPVPSIPKKPKYIVLLSNPVYI